jgi:molybdopterin-guanine dinucleotide biosynthesis protein B
VSALVSELRRRGYTVGTVKDIHFEGYEADDPNTDTYKHRKAGARRVTALGPNDTSIIVDRHMKIEEILKYYKEDFVILEGDSGLKCPNIISGRTTDDLDKRMDENTIAFTGIIAGNTNENNGEPALKEYKGMPVINGITEVEKMADLVEKKTSVEEMDVELFVGGKEIGLVPFVQKTLKNVVVGAIKALDGYEEGEEIVIRIK